MKKRLGFWLVTLCAVCTVCAESVWPIRVLSGDHQITVFPLQPDQMDDGVLSGRTALAVVPAGQSDPVYGVLRLEARVVADAGTQTVALKDVHVKDVSLYDLSREQEVQLASAISLHSVTWEISYPQETLNAMLTLAESSPFDRSEGRMPRTASVPRESQLEVTYDGTPRFEPIKGTRLQYAVNTEFQVIRDGDDYYCADGGVWYEAPDPVGPWVVTDRITAKIHTIPPSSPLYNTRFLYVGGHSDRDVCYGFYPGYLNGACAGGRPWRWGVDFESPDYSIQVDPVGGSIYYREKSSYGVPPKRKSWSRDDSKFPEFEK